MRSLLPYRCVDCGAELGAAWTCAACGGEARDLAGKPPAAFETRRTGRRARPWRWALGLLPPAIAAAAAAIRPGSVAGVSLWALALGGGAVAGVLLVLALEMPALDRWRRDRRDRRAAQARREAAGVLRAIVDARVGDAVRVRGRVRTIRAVQDPSGRGVAAFRERRLEGGVLAESSGCGRLAIDDATGVAIVDDDAFQLEPLDRVVFGGGAATLELVDGDLIEVIGPARIEAPPADAGVSPDRGDVTVLVFDGRPDAPVLLVPLPPGATLASPRLFGGTSAPQDGSATRDHQALAELEAGDRADAEERGRFTGGGGG